MAITSCEARCDLVRLIERVNDEYDALRETSYLLSSPANGHRLLSALQSLRAAEKTPDLAGLDYASVFVPR